jgi:hypothetical protein
VLVVTARRSGRWMRRPKPLVTHSPYFLWRFLGDILR